MENVQNETIAGISTPLSSGAISIVRMSGEKAIEIADKVFKSSKNLTPSSFTPRMLTLGTFFANNFKEQALCVVFKAPKSYTGENMVEFQCHGGVLITKGILATLIANGARLATAGEFTKRAFMNGKMALSDAEGMMDMINAQSEAEIRAGYNLLTGELSKTATDAQKELVDILSEIEVSFDYPEEDIEYTTKKIVKNRLKTLDESIEKVLKNSQNSKIIKDGVHVVILGKPNVGKSSLLNALLKDDKAIVTEVAGTTRDIIEGSFSINGLRFNLYDTAGIHETTDKVEKIGVDKAKSAISSADIILFVRDEENLDKEEKEINKLLEGKKHLTIINKADKTGNFKSDDNTLRISALKKQNIELLTNKLYSMVAGNMEMQGGLILANQRHIDALSRAEKHLKNALESIDNYSLDIVTIDINLAYSALGEITGSTTNEEILNAIFSKFCLGK